MTEDGATRTFGFIEILSPDGSVERAVGIEAAVFELGQTAEGLAFPDDAQMADRQARLYCDDGSDRVWLEDLGVGSGVWLRIEGPKDTASPR